MTPGPGGAALVAAVAPKACAAAELNATGALCVGCGLKRRTERGGAVVVSLIARTAKDGVLHFACDGVVVKTPLRVTAPPPSKRCALPTPPGARVAWLAPPRPPRPSTRRRAEIAEVDLGLGRTLALSRGLARGLALFDGLTRRGESLVTAVTLEATGCDGWRRSSEALEKAGDDDASYYEWRWTAASACATLFVKAIIVPDEGRVIVTVDASAPLDLSVLATFRKDRAKYATPSRKSWRPSKKSGRPFRVVRNVEFEARPPGTPRAWASEAARGPPPTHGPGRRRGRRTRRPARRPAWAKPGPSGTSSRPRVVGEIRRGPQFARPCPTVAESFATEYSGSFQTTRGDRPGSRGSATPTSA